MSVPETEGSNEDRISEMYYEALSDLGNAIISNGEKGILAYELVKLRWEEQQ